MDLRPEARGKQCAGLVVALVALLVVPASASATVRCVPLSNTTDCAQSYSSIQSAVAASSPTGDTIRIAGGPSYNEHVDATGKTITFIGAGAGPPDGAPGPGDTVIAPATTGTALSLPNGGTVQSLRVVGTTPPNGAGSTAIAFASSGDFTLNLTGVVARGGDGTGGSSAGAAGLAVTNGDDTSKDTRVVSADSTLTGGSGFNGAYGASFGAAGGTGSLTGTDTNGGDGFSPGFGLFVSKGGNVTQTASSSNGAGIYNSTFTATRTRFRGSRLGPGFQTPVLVSGLPSGVNKTVASSATVVDSQLLSSDDSGPGDAAAYVNSTANASASLTARNSTIVLEGASSGGAVSAIRFSGNLPATASLVNTVARVENPSGGTDLNADGGSITATNSSFSTRTQANGGTATAPGSGGNISGAPGFTNVAAEDFSLVPSSPLIDRGNPAVVTSGERDLFDNPRLQGPAPDIGAFERQVAEAAGVSGQDSANEPPAATAFASTNKVFAPLKPGGQITSARKRSVKRGTRFTYLLSEGATVDITIKRKLKGRRAKRKGKRVCAKRTRKNRKKRTCTRYKWAGTITTYGNAGANSTPFTGRFGGKALKPGLYRATLVALDPEGAESNPLRLGFRIVKP